MANGDFLRYVGGRLQEFFALVSSSGPTDAGKIVKTDGTGRLHMTLLPTGIGQETLTMATAENLSAGDLVSLFVDEYDALIARKADASDPTKVARGFVLEATNAPATATVHFWGINGEVSGLTPGADLFLSADQAGALTETPPTDDGYIAQHVGYALSESSMYFDPMGMLVVRAEDA